MTLNKQILVFSITLGLIYAHKEVGDLCTVKSSGSPGKCKIFDDCQKVVDDLEKRNIYPETCGFQGTRAIVCCPKKPRKVGDISKKKCKEYSKYVWVLEDSPLFISNAPKHKRNECGHEVTTLIIGGTEADRKEFPHMTAIGYEQDSGEISWICGGSLISDQYVLTAAHCLHRPITEQKVTHIRLGITKLDDTENRQDFKISRMIAHPDYRYPSNYHDIALIQLNRPVKMNPNAIPACLYTKLKIATKRATATGWGTTTDQGFTPSNHLLKVVLDLVPQRRCSELYRGISVRYLASGIVENIQICAGPDFGTKDTCQGDSGGPLQIYHTGDDTECMYDIVGITSVGTGCGAEAGVYVRVSNYIKWIEDIVWAEDVA